jgi:hypothetical protein
MKKTISFILIITLIAVFAGCSPSPSEGTGVPGVNLDIGNGAADIGGVNASPTENIVTPQPAEAAVTAIPDGGLVDSFANFVKIEMASINLLGPKVSVGEDQELSKCNTACGGLYYGTMDVMAIEALAGGDYYNELLKYGFTDISISKDGDVYKVTFKAGKSELRLDTQYDKATDSMTATLNDTAGKTQMCTFEYVLAGNAYVVQFYMKADSGYNIFTGLVNGSDIASFGMQTTDKAPQSIYKNNTLTADFVKSGSFYCVLSGSDLSVTDNGVTKMY